VLLYRLLPLTLVAACGRIGFTERPAGDGALDDGALTDAAPLGWSRLTAYADQTCAVIHGLAYCWGANGSGQLGNGTTADAPRPVQVALPAGTIDDLSVGESQGCAIVAGTPSCWGSLGTPAPQVIPVGNVATALAVGHGFQCVIAGSTRCWGDNNAGDLGVGDTNPRNAPTQINYAGISAIVAIEAGDDHACSLDSSNVARCWGHDDYGALGTGAMIGSSSSPVVVTGGIAALPQIGGWHACALQAGRVWCWGENDHGELGDGGPTSTATPQLVPSLTSVTALAVGGGPADGDASCAIGGGGVKCWGNGATGRLGQGVAASSPVPVDVVGLPGPATALTIGYGHACARLADGDVWCWGRGDRGQLGNGLSASSLAPVKVAVP
jgi:alpha-tubulin suppressor-like RCC1 family protein